MLKAIYMCLSASLRNASLSRFGLPRLKLLRLELLSLKPSAVKLHSAESAGGSGRQKYTVHYVKGHVHSKAESHVSTTISDPDYSD